jgi:prevent-host-death family protein
LDISIGEAHNRLSALLKQVDKGPIKITRRGKAVGVIISAEEYEQYRQVSAYLQMIHLSRTLLDSGISASDIYHAGRDELENKP